MSGEEDDTPDSYTYIHFVYSLLLFMIGVPGNLSIIYFFWYKKYKNKALMSTPSCNLHMSRMAVCDLVVCVFRFLPYPFYVSGALTGNRMFVYTMYTIPFVGSDVSLWCLWRMSLSRYWKITKPFSDTPRIKSYMLLIPLLVSMFVYFPASMVLTEGSKSLLVLLVVQYVISIIIMVVLPVSSIVILYVKTSKFLKQQSEFVRKNTQKQDEHNHNINAMKTLKALTISMIVTVAIPRFLLIIENGIGSFGKVTIGEDLYEGIECFVYNLLFTNNAINIFIYLKLVKRYKRFVFSKLPFCNKSTVRVGIVNESSDQESRWTKRRNERDTESTSQC